MSRSSTWWILFAVLALPGLSTGLSTGCIRGPLLLEPEPEPEPEPDPGSLRLIFHDPGEQAGPSEACEAELCRSLLERIEAAEESIEFAVYGMRGQPELLAALVAARERGVVIRGVVDRELDGSNVYDGTDLWVEALGDVHDDLESEIALAEGRTPYEGTPACDPPEGFEGPVQCLSYDLGDRCLLAAHASREALEPAGALMHNKFFVFDRRYVWTGSTNLSGSGTGGYNANAVAVIDSPQVAAWYAREVEQMYAGRFHAYKPPDEPMIARVGEAEVELMFSPQSHPLSDRVRERIQRATRRIDVAAFFLTHKGIAGDLIDAHLRGVEVRVILDATGASNEYTKHELLRAVGIPVIVESWGGKMHMKSAAIDGEWVIVGSMNWTSAGERDNDENTLLIRSPAHAEEMHAYFEQIWGGFSGRFLRGRADPESADSPFSCADGSDNDFDGLTDAEDPGCSAAPPPLDPLPPWRIVPEVDGVCDESAAPLATGP